jgi:hypothetical protein
MNDETVQERFGREAAALVRLVDERMKRIEPDWHPPNGEYEFGLTDDDEVVVVAGEAAYTLAGDGETLVESTRGRVRLIEDDGVLEDFTHVRPDEN